jgi:Arc/MetJ family transcription regulator
MAIYILYDSVDFSDAIALQRILNTTSGLNGPAEIVMVPPAPALTAVNSDAVIVIWSAVSRGNVALTDAAAANANRLIQVAATGATAEAVLPDVIPITDSAAIIARLQKPPFDAPVNPPTDRWLSDQRILIIMAIIIATVLLLFWIVPSDDHLSANCRTSYTQEGYPIEHCEDSYY